MSKIIYKYKLPRDGQSITIEEYVIEVLHIGTQDGWPILWAIVDTDKYQETEVVAWGTGWPLPDDVYYETDYWGTAEDAAGYVWHYFAATRSSDLWTEDSARKYVDSDYAKITALESTGQPYTISISCDNNSAIDGLICNKVSSYQPSLSVADIHTSDVTISHDNLIGMIEKRVGSSNTATHASAR